MLQVAIGLRSASRGYMPDKSFVIVSLVFTAFTLIGWRTGLAALTQVIQVTLYQSALLTLTHGAVSTLSCLLLSANQLLGSEDLLAASGLDRK